jgi:hypothetical protein
MPGFLGFWVGSKDFVVFTSDLFFLAGLVVDLADSAATPQETKQSITNRQNVFWMAFIRVQLYCRGKIVLNPNKRKVKKHDYKA